MAWEMHKEKNAFDLVQILPGIILGPLMTTGDNASLSAIIRIFNGTDPRLPNIAFPHSDVRDVAESCLQSI